MSRIFITLVLSIFVVMTSRGDDPLPSWNETPTKQAILDFVNRVTAEGTKDFVPAPERIATFDNDGTLWSEQPVYVQLAFALDRVRALAESHPEWKTEEPFASILRGDLKTVAAGGKESLFKLIMATHSGMTSQEFSDIAKDWIATSRHPETKRRYTEMVYQPMLELLAFLRQNGFRTFIVSGGGIDFMRPWTEEVYGIPPEQVVGSRVKKSFEIRDGQPVVVRLPEMDFVDDKEGKPVGIQTHIGRRPILAVGNSDGDFEMLQWTTAGAGSRMAIYIHHTDSEREVAYDRDSAIGRLDRGLDEGKRLGWTFVDMKADWATIYPEVQPQDSGEPSKAESLIGKWLAEDIEGRGVVDRAQSTLEIAEDGGVSGSTAVNQYFGKATVTDGSIRFGPLGSTLRAGSPALMDQERRFTTALGKVARFRTSSQGMLYLLDGSGKELIKFSRMDD